MRFLLAILPLVAAHAQKPPNFKTDVQLVRLLVNVKNRGRRAGRLAGKRRVHRFRLQCPAGDPDL